MKASYLRGVNTYLPNLSPNLSTDSVDLLKLATEAVSAQGCSESIVIMYELYVLTYRLLPSD